MTKKKTLKEFLIEANKVHNNKYDYSESEYIGTDTNMTIICPIHGPFQQTPYRHLKGKECRKCGSIKRGNTLKCTKHQFLTKANLVHNNKYDYSSLKFSGLNTKANIICPHSW